MENINITEMNENSKIDGDVLARRARQREYYNLNREKIRERRKRRYEVNKEAILVSQKKRYERERPKILEAQRDYFKRKYHSDPEGCKARSKAWKKANPEKTSSYRRKYAEHKRRYDVSFRLAASLRARIHQALRGNGKSSPLEELLGCDLFELRNYLESKFQPGMSWDNNTRDGWHIDHIRPCASFDLTDPEQQKQCFHYTNLQPLWAKDNLSKGGRWV